MKFSAVVREDICYRQIKFGAMAFRPAKLRVSSVQKIACTQSGLKCKQKLIFWNNFLLFIYLSYAKFLTRFWCSQIKLNDIVVNSKLHWNDEISVMLA